MLVLHQSWFSFRNISKCSGVILARVNIPELFSLQQHYARTSNLKLSMSSHLCSLINIIFKQYIQANPCILYTQTWVVSPCSWASTQLAARATFQLQASRASLHVRKLMLAFTLSAVACRRLCRRANLMAWWTSQFEILSAATQHSADICEQNILNFHTLHVKYYNSILLILIFT